MGKLKKFLALNRAKKLLLVEAVVALARGRVMVWLPFSKVAPSLGFHMKETPLAANAEEARKVRQVTRAIALMHRHTPWQTHCLARAFAGMNMLKRRGIESTLYLGTGKDENGKMIAHAWLRSGEIYVTGDDVMDQFTVVATYAKAWKTQEEEIVQHEKG